MANTISMASSMSVSNLGLTASVAPTISVTQVGNAVLAGVQTIGATTEQISFGDVATPGYIFCKNLDATNFILISLVTPAVSGTSFAKLLPGEFCLVPTRQTTVYAIADTSPCDLQVIIAEL
jgi:hypothetical protein